MVLSENEWTAFILIDYDLTRALVSLDVIAFYNWSANTAMTSKEVVFNFLKISIVLHSLANSMAFLYYRIKTCAWFVTLFLKLVKYLVNEKMGRVKLYKGNGAIDAMKTTSIWNAWSHKFQRHFAGFKSYYCCYCCAQLLSHIWLFVTPWTVAHQVGKSHGIFQTRILEWHAISYPGDLPGPGIKPMSLAFPPLAGGFFTTEPPGKQVSNHTIKSLLWKFLGTAKKRKIQIFKN